MKTFIFTSHASVSGFVEEYGRLFCELRGEPFNTPGMHGPAEIDGGHEDLKTPAGAIPGWVGPIEAPLPITGQDISRGIFIYRDPVDSLVADFVLQQGGVRCLAASERFSDLSHPEEESGEMERFLLERAEFLESRLQECANFLEAHEKVLVLSYEDAVLDFASWNRIICEYLLNEKNTLVEQLLYESLKRYFRNKGNEQEDRASLSLLPGAHKRILTTETIQQLKRKFSSISERFPSVSGRHTDGRKLPAKTSFQDPFVINQRLRFELLIFGTGALGKRVLNALKGVHCIRGFVDNDPKKQDSAFEGLPVYSAGNSISQQKDFYVVASMYSKEIVEQLLKLEVPVDQIIVISPRLREAEIQNAIWVRNIPKILVLSDEVVSHAHGTGAVLIRHMDKIPKECVAHGYLTGNGYPHWENSQQISDASLTTGHREIQHWEEWLLDLEKALFLPDLIYANFFSEEGLRILRKIHDRFGGKIPFIQHFHDVQIRNEACFTSELRNLASRAFEFWAIGQRIKERVERTVQQPVRLMNTFKLEVQDNWKRLHAFEGARFRSVILGNVYEPDAFGALKQLWNEFMRRHPEVDPIQWIGHPNSIARIEQSGFELEPEVEYYGFLGRKVLRQTLAQFDLAIIPFNTGTECQSDYGRYSIPSRISELAELGVPVVAFCSEDTDLHAFIQNHKIGVSLPFEDRERGMATLSSLFENPELRKKLGFQARLYSMRNCRLDEYQKLLHERFVACAATGSSKCCSPNRRPEGNKS